MNERKQKKYQHNADFEQLLDQKLDLLEEEYRQAQTPEEKEQVLKNHGFSIKEFYLTAIRKVLACMIRLGVKAYLQRAADYLGIGRQTVYDNQ